MTGGVDSHGRTSDVHDRRRIRRLAGAMALLGTLALLLTYAATSWVSQERRPTSGARDSGDERRAAPAATERVPIPNEYERPLVPIFVSGRTLAERVESAVEQAQERYPNFIVEVEGLSADAVLLRVGWENPHLTVKDPTFADEIGRRVGDSREATLLLLKTLARTNPRLRHLGAYEERFIVPIWSRRQILRASDPANYRDFHTFADFQLTAKIRGGDAALFETNGLEQ